MVKQRAALIFALFLFGTLIAGRAQSPVFSWVKTAGGSTNDSAKFVATDPQGNVIVTGYFRGSVTFGSTTLTNEGNLDGYLAKYDHSGTLLWVQQIRGDGALGDVGYGLAVQDNGNILVTGNFSGTATFGTNALISAGSHDMFLAKYDGFGNVLWSTRAGGVNDDIGLHVSVDSSGNSLVTGYFRNLCSFGTTNLNSGSANYSDSYIAKYNASGQLLWVNQIGGPSFDSGYVAVFDSLGNIYATGYFNTSGTFAGTTLTGVSDEMYIAKYDSSGALLWARSAGSTGSDKGSSIAVDSQNNAYVSGWFQNTIAFPGTNLVSRGSYDSFLAKYNDSSGTFLWVRQLGGTGTDFAQSIMVDNTGTVCLCGDFQGTINLDGTTLTAANTNAGISSLFLAKYDSNGLIGSARQFGNTYNNHAHLWAHRTGELYVAGNFSGGASFDSFSFVSNGDLDAFVGELVVPPTLSISRSGSNVVIYWPTNRTGFQLQRALTFPGETNWTTVPVGIFGSYYLIGDSATNPASFYRLRK